MTEKIKHSEDVKIPYFKTLTVFGTFIGLILAFAYLLIKEGWSFDTTLMLIVIGWGYDAATWLLIFVVTPGFAVMTGIMVAKLLNPGRPLNNYVEYCLRLCASISLSFGVTMLVVMVIYPFTVCQSYLSFCG